jgi:hypothetical protein
MSRSYISSPRWHLQAVAGQIYFTYKYPEILYAFLTLSAPPPPRFLLYILYIPSICSSKRKFYMIISWKLYSSQKPGTNPERAYSADELRPYLCYKSNDDGEFALN